MKATFTVLPS